MKIKYFTATALFEFSSSPVAETREVSEAVYLDLDAEGNIVNMTIEHAKQKAGMKEFAFQEMQTA